MSALYHFRFTASIGVAATLVLVSALSTARAQALFDVSAGPGNRIGCDHGGQSTFGSLLPASAHHACADAIGTTQADASSSYGQVAAATMALTLVDFPTLQREDIARAKFSDTLVFSKTDSGVADVFPASLNLSLVGSIFGDKSTGRSAVSAANVTVTFQSRTLQLQLSDNGTSLNILNFAGFSGTESITRAHSGFSASLTSPTVVTRVGLMSFDMMLEVSSMAFLKDALSNSNFLGGLTFAVGMDVFNLPAGYTVNAGTYLVNNRFTGNMAPVPEPGSSLLLAGGLLALGALARHQSWNQRSFGRKDQHRSRS